MEKVKDPSPFPVGYCQENTGLKISRSKTKTRFYVAVLTKDVIKPRQLHNNPRERRGPVYLTI